MSFIIPAQNEELLLPNTLDSIHNATKQQLTYEVILINNASTDNTASIAASKGARVINQETGTIGSLRNTGVKNSLGEFLVFLDADVTLTDTWYEEFRCVLNSLKADPLIITGSRCSTVDSAGWIAKSWFQSKTEVHQTTHVGTGHMITSKHLFNSVSGFDDRLVTGEDFDFCSRAKQFGAKVYENQNLKVIHHGVPNTLNEFIQREIWHGLGDALSLNTFITSKVAILSAIFFVSHITLVLSLLFNSRLYWLPTVSLVIIFLICIISSWKKYYFAPLSVIFRNIFLYYLYFWGRSISIFVRIIPVYRKHRPRSGRIDS